MKRLNLVGMKPRRRPIPLIKKKPKPQKSSIDVVVVNESVAIRFPEPISNAVFTPEQAKGLAEVLIKLATKIEEETEDAIT